MNIYRRDTSIVYEDEQGRELAKLAYEESEDGYRVVSTYVDPSLRGQGVAGKLLEAFVEFLQEVDGKAIPVCSYAVTWFERHPEYATYVVREM